MRHSEDYYKARIKSLESLLEIYKNLNTAKDEQINKLNEYIRKHLEGGE